MATVIRPPTVHEGYAIILSVVFCFVLSLIAIYYTCTRRYAVVVVTLITGVFFVLMIYGMKGNTGWMNRVRHQ